MLTTPEPVPTSGAPENYELKFAAGTEVDQALLDKATPIFRELNLSNEGAQKVADFYAEMQAGDAAAAQTEVDEWIEQCKANPEIGGVNFETNVKKAQAALGWIGTPTLSKFLSETGMGSHPEVVGMFLRLHNKIGEDTIAGRSGPSQMTTHEQELAEMYPSMSTPDGKPPPTPQE